jgi:chloramphenicol-sensitive protein RarD
MDPATRAGWAFALSAFGWWGVSPLYWRAVATSSAYEVLAHRVVWGLLVYAAMAWRWGRLREVGAALRVPHTRRVFGLTAALLLGNWFAYIAAVATGQVLQASLGYFINPIVSVLLGMLVLGERLRPLQWTAVALAVVGVVTLGTLADAFPWLALGMAFSFGFYGFARKTAPLDALPGGTLETLLMLPAAIAVLVWLALTGQATVLQGDPLRDGLLALSGVVTAVPLLWFSLAARRLPLSTIGLLQYLSPSLQFVLAVAWFGEPFTSVHLASFACIWLGLAAFTLDARLSR